VVNGRLFNGILLLVLLLAAPAALAQDLEPRRWTHMPTGLNVIGAGLLYTRGDIVFDPVLQIEEGEFENNATALVYLRSFGMFDKSARIDFTLPYASGRWSGLLEGEPASTRRRGIGDPRIRLSMLLYGAPAESPEQFATSEKSDWIVGAAVSVTLPYGDYLEERLLNLGQNRWIIRPQLGVTHLHGKWTYELTGSLFWYGDNDEFWGGNELENDHMYYLQGHVIYTFRPGLWASLSSGYGNGASPTVNGLPKDAETKNWLTALSVGIPINRQQGLKLAWLRLRTQNETGADFDSVALAWSVVF